MGAFKHLIRRLVRSKNAGFVLKRSCRTCWSAGEGAQPQSSVASCQHVLRKCRGLCEKNTKLSRISRHRSASELFECASANPKMHCFIYPWSLSPHCKSLLYFRLLL